MAFATIDMTKGITGTIPVANGGTGTTSYTAGISVAEEWVLTSNKTSAGDITANLSLSSFAGVGTINASMSESSGVFTFPSTGIWFIGFNGLIEEGSQSSNVAIIEGRVSLEELQAFANKFNVALPEPVAETVSEPTQEIT